MLRISEQRRQRGRPARLRQTRQGGRAHLARGVCETFDYRVGRAGSVLWRKVRRADRVNPFQMRHELAGSEAWGRRSSVSAPGWRRPVSPRLRGNRLGYQ